MGYNLLLYNIEFGFYDNKLIKLELLQICYDKSKDRLEIEFRDVIGDYLGKKTEVKKKTLTDFINQAKNTIVNGINSMTEMAENHSKNADNANLNKSSDTSQNKFPSANVLLNQ